MATTTRSRNAASRGRGSTKPDLLSTEEAEVKLQLGRRSITLTNLDKVFWPRLHLAKRHLLQHYLDVSPWLLPHLKDRAMVMKRYPDGINGEFFFMKRVPDNAPDWLPTCSIRHKGGNVIAFPMVQDLITLLWVVNLGCIDLNQWYARCDDTDRPDYLHFDLDPVEGTPWPRVLETALLLRAELEAMGMKPLVKTSGASGMHVYVAIRRGPLQKQVWEVAKAIATEAAGPSPEADDGRLSRRRSPRPHGAGRLQPERLGPHPRLHLFAAAHAGGHRLDACHLARGGAGYRAHGLHHSHHRRSAPGMR